MARHGLRANIEIMHGDGVEVISTPVELSKLLDRPSFAATVQLLGTDVRARLEEGGCLVRIKTLATPEGALTVGAYMVPGRAPFSEAEWARMEPVVIQAVHRLVRAQVAMAEAALSGDRWPDLEVRF